MTHYSATKLRRLRPKAKLSRPASIPRKRPSTWLDALYKEQVKAFKFVMSRPATALFCVPGTGKTYLSLAVLEQLDDWRVALIVAPKTSLGITWRPKLKTLMNVTLLSSPQELVKALRANRQDILRRYIVLANSESLRRTARSIAKRPWDIVIWDESQGAKQRSSAASRLARRLRHVPRRIALSGTPIDKGQIDIWAQMRFVDHEVFGEDWKDFADEYCYKGGFKDKKWFFDEDKHQQFLDALKDHIFRLNDKFLKLKPITVIPVPILLLGKQHQFYETMQRDSLIEVDGVVITANNAGARDVKLSQITGGAVLDRENIARHVGNAKLRKLSHILKTVDKPVVIFCQYLHEIDIILSSWPIGSRVTVIQGSVKDTDRTRIVKDFQAGRYDGLICQVRTGGESIDLTRASTLILYSMGFSYINFEQVLRRLQRGGQKRAVKAYIFFCHDTIDEDKLQLVRSKGEKSNSVLTFFEEE